MNIKINGLYEKNILIALENLVKAFDRQNKIVLNDFDYSIYIATIIYKHEVKLFLRCDKIVIEEKTKILSDTSYDKKYLILACFYKFLVILTNKELSYGVLTGIRPTKLVYQYKKHYSDKEVLSILQEKYLISLEKAKLLLLVVNNQLRLIKDFELFHNEVSVYINIPFCLSRCSYCSFTSYPSNYQKVTQEAYLEVLIDEIKETGKCLKKNKIPITTIYIGGGTPTALNDDQLSTLLENIENHLIFNPVREYTLECGRPDSITESKLKLIKETSVSRISINPQTFNDNTLNEINRKHTVDEILRVYKQAKEIGFNNINMDLIIGLPNETLKDYIHSINKTVELLPESITIHYLAQKRGAMLFDEEINHHIDDYFVLFSYAYDTLQKHNYVPYYLYRQKNISGNLENVGYSKKGNESLYNILMIEEQQTIIGLGCGASTKFLNHELIINPKDLISYMKSYKSYLKKKINSIKEYFLKVEAKEIE